MSPDVRWSCYGVPDRSCRVLIGLPPGPAGCTCPGHTTAKNLGRNTFPGRSVLTPSLGKGRMKYPIDDCSHIKINRVQASEKHEKAISLESNPNPFPSHCRWLKNTKNTGGIMPSSLFYQSSLTDLSSNFSYSWNCGRRRHAAGLCRSKSSTGRSQNRHCLDWSQVLSVQCRLCFRTRAA